MVGKISSRSSFEVKQPVPVQRAPAPQPPVGLKPARLAFGNEFSTGQGSALRAKALSVTGASSLAAKEGPDELAKSKWPEGPLGESDTVNPETAVMQARLAELGYMETLPEESQGLYGDLTTDAVSQFQRTNGLPVTGEADVATLALMASDEAVTPALALAVMENVSIGAVIGLPGPRPVPTLDTLELPPQTAVINADPAASMRAAPNGARLEQSLLPGTEVVVTRPQPEGGDGWLHVTAVVDGEEISGWVSNGFDEIDLVQEAALLGDPRVQARLEDLGYLPPDAAQSELVIADFQQMNGLEVTGTLDDATLEAMWSRHAVMSNHLRQVTNPTWNHSADAPATSNNCGPTSVAMALAAVGLSPIDNADPQEAIDVMREAMGFKNDGLTGSADIEAGISAGGGTSYRVDSTEEVQLAIANGDPVVLYGWNEEYDTYHWITVQGFDPATQTWLVSDPLSANGVQRWTQAEYDAYVRYDEPSVAVVNPAG